MRPLIFVLAFIFLGACGRFSFSPYVVDPKQIDSNARNLSKLLGKSFTASSEFNKGVRFVVISDTHDYYDGLEKQVRYINKKRDWYDFVVVNGDISNVGLQGEFERSYGHLSKLKIPFFVVPGNHDLLIDGHEIFEAMFGALSLAFDYGGTTFIFYNNNNWESSGNVPDFDWVESKVKDAKGPIILIAHVSPFDKDRFGNAESERIESLMDRYNIKMHINGHDHNPGVKNFSSTPFVTVGSSSKSVVLDVEVSREEASFAHKNI